LLTLLATLTLWVALTGGASVEVWGLTVSLRDWRRPALVGALILAVTVWRSREEGRITALCRAAVLTLLFLAAALSFSYLVTSAGGLDSHGYVSAARMLTSGRLWLPQPTGWLPIPDALEALTPLGYVAAEGNEAIVPRFPLGLPLVMAVFMWVFGAQGPFLVSPVMGIGAVLATVLLMRQVTDRFGTLVAAAVIAIQPVFFAYALQPMSDVAATGWLVLAAALLMRERPYALLAGCAAGMALWTRPQLGLAVLVLPLLPMVPRNVRVRYAGAVSPWLVGLMAVQWLLYGSPFRSGYGNAEAIFGIETLGVNTVVHGRWLLVDNSPLLLVGLAAAWWRGNRAFLTSAVALFAAVTTPYLLYLSVFDDWEVHRFLLPGVVFLLMSAAEGTIAVMRRYSPRLALQPALAVVVWILAATSYGFIDRRAVFERADAESKFPRVAAWVTARTQPTDAVISSLHSGSVRYYAGRTTVRWDRIPADGLAAVVRAIEERGGESYLALDGNDEREMFRERFGEPPAGVRIDVLDRIRTVDLAKVTVIR
jgi:hypothetical protein